MPAYRGEARLVPPIRNSSYFTPSENVCVWPTAMPVDGSASAATSGTTRCVVLMADTTPFWYAGCGKIRDVPPPAPYW